MLNHQFKSFAIKIQSYNNNIEYYHHERVVAERLGFDSLDSFHEFVDQAKKGGVGERFGRDPFAYNPTPYNFKINVGTKQDNILHFNRETMGRKLKEEHRHDNSEPSVHVVDQEEHYYIFKKYSSNNSENFLPLNITIDIIRVVTGNFSHGDKHTDAKVMTRRRNQWKACMQGSDNTYYRTDLVHIANEYGRVLGVQIEEVVSSTSHVILNRVRDELVVLLKCSYVLGDEDDASVEEEEQATSPTPPPTNNKPTNATAESEQSSASKQSSRGSNRRARGSSHKKNSLMNVTVTQSSKRFKHNDMGGGDEPSDDESSDDESSDDESSEDEYDDDSDNNTPKKKRGKKSSTIAIDDVSKDEFNNGVTLSERELLRNVIAIGNYKHLWKMGKYDKVGSYEVAILCIIDGKDKHSTKSEIRRLGGVVLPEYMLDILIDIKGRQSGGSILNRKKMDFKKLKEQTINIDKSRIPIGKEDYILDHLLYRERWIKGVRFPREVMKICKDNSQPMLTDEAAACIRQMLYMYKIKLSNFNGLLNSMAVYYLDRPLDLSEFASTQTIRLWLVRLSIIDRYHRGEEDRKYFCKGSRFGAPISYGLTADDTQHGDKKQAKSHVALRTIGFAVSDDDEEDAPGFKVGSGWELLTTSKAVSETNKDNAALNFEVLKERVNENVLPFLNTYVFDNAALGEGEETHALLMKWLAEHQNPEISKWTHYFGFKRKPIILNDFFHCCNILISLASVTFSGDSERNLREFHHRRILQHLHDICSREKVLSNYVALKIIEEELDDEEFADEEDFRATARERQERWKSNGEFCRRFIFGCRLKLKGGACFWVRWAQEMVMYLDKSNFKYEVLEEIAKMSMNESIIVSLTFEAELVTEYFDITYASHSFGGENNERAGFRLTELHYLLIDFIIPFWTGGLDDPSKCFPETIKAIEAMSDDSQKAMKKDQMGAVFKAVNERMAKLYERWFKAPLIFLLITHPTHGPPLLRAMLKVISEVMEEKKDETFFEFDLDGEYNEGLFPNVVLYEPDPNNEWGPYQHVSDDMKPWYDMLVDHREDVLHFYGQFGFVTSMLRDELKNLSKENIPGQPDTNNGRNPSSTTRLKEFYDEYPKIYDFIRAAFSHGPSNSRISEMAHSLTRVFFDSSIPSARLDDMLNFIMGQGYLWKQERREVASKTRDTSKGKGKRGRGAVKDLDLKLTQVMSGDQLHKSLPSRYSEEAVDALPDEIQQEIKLTKISKTGTTKRDKKRQNDIIERYEKIKQRKIARGTAQALDVDRLEREASQTQTKHDKQWSSQSITNRQTLVSNFMKKTYYSGITGKVDPNDRKSQNRFHHELQMVLPFFWNEEVSKAKIGDIKKNDADEKINLNLHLQKIKGIAFEGKENTLDPETDLTNKSKLEIQEHFIKVDKSPNIAKVEADLASQREKVKNIFKSIGTTICALNRYKPKKRHVVDPNADEDTADDVATTADEVAEESPLYPEFTLGDGCE